ncbi:hypothetical protein P9112_001666 [Eukaryota sp. TZLM1-RC]
MMAHSPHQSISFVPPTRHKDYSEHKGINDLTVPVPADFSRITDVCSFLSSATYAATLDLLKAFWQLNLRPEDQPKTAIVIPGRKVMFTFAALGLKNVQVIFQNLMKQIFDCNVVFIYLNDIVVAAVKKTDFLSGLEYIFMRARDYRVLIGLHKCALQTQEYPIRVICPSRIEKLNKIPVPTTVPKLCLFLGSINFVRDWLPAVNTELAPLTELQKGTPHKFTLNQQQIECFQNIKKMIPDSVPLEFSDDIFPILVSTDASKIGFAGIICKELSSSTPETCLSEKNVAPLSFH